MIRELEAGDISLSYRGRSFSNIVPGMAITGQERAIGLLRLGLETDRAGYNIFLSGDDGSGRLNAILEEIGKIENDTSGLKDAAYAYSPDNERPRVLIFPKGKAKAFQHDLDGIMEGRMTREEVSAAWEDPAIIQFIASLPSPEEYPDAYKLGIVLDRTLDRKRPTIIEMHPSHRSLFGMVSEGSAPHLSIKIGSYQRAAGGFLILNAEEISSDETLWKTFRRYIEMTVRALTSDSVMGEMMGGVRPSPIPLLTKVILIGNEGTFDRLMEKDPKFTRYFRIAPEFDYTMPADEKNIAGTISYLKSAGHSLLAADDSAYAEILRYSSWLAEDRNKLTTELSLLGDLLEEASRTARLEGKDAIQDSDVRRAIELRSWYASLAEDRINEEIKSGEMVISLSGKKIGIVNGLAVMDRGTSSFGTPAVISVAVAPGNEGIVNIEHEAGLSGGIHDKGLLILEGYLRNRYARTFPLSLYAGICFEQSYAEVDGDSASLAELYALLSAIGGIPIRQDIAVTGSMSQTGTLLPVGGINEKIEGFFNACSTAGLTGSQGVIIPEVNRSALILSGRIEEAINKGLFHIWTISEIDEGMTLLTGLDSGERDRKGIFPAGSFSRKVEDGLRNLWHCSQDKG